MKNLAHFGPPFADSKRVGVAKLKLGAGETAGVDTTQVEAHMATYYLFATNHQRPGGMLPTGSTNFDHDG